MFFSYDYMSALVIIFAVSRVCNAAFSRKFSHKIRIDNE